LPQALQGSGMNVCDPIARHHHPVPMTLALYIFTDRPTGGILHRNTLRLSP